VPLKFKLTMRIEGRPDGIVHGEFSDDEHKRLLLYLEQYSELAQSKPCREGLPCHISLNWHEGTPLDVQTSLPDSDTLGILLHRLRPFILKSEPASFNSVCSLLGKAVADKYVRHLLRDQRELFDGRRSQQMMKIASNHVVVNSERVLYDWLNSHEYHRDPDKRESMDGLFRGTPGDLTRGERD
jgi:hypothetical protein